MQHLTLSVTLGLTLSLASLPVMASPDSQQAVIERSLDGLPAPEWIAKVATIVSTSKRSEQTDSALAGIRVIVSRKAALAPAAVSAMVRVAPHSTTAIAAEAAKLSPKQAQEIVDAASAAVPSQAQAVVAAVNKTVDAHQGTRVSSPSELLTRRRPGFRPDNYGSPR